MPSSAGQPRHDAGVTKPAFILERPMYGIAEAAGFLGLRPDRARAWLDGYERQGVHYPPVIQEELTGNEIVTWGEFVELGYLREYRRKGVPLQRLRPVIGQLRREFGTPYPLATAKPYIFGKELVLKLQEENDIPRAIAIVISSGRTIALAADEAKRFLKKVEFDQPEHGDARRLRPARPASPVVIDPLARFGRPSVQGVATERLWELFDAGESLDEIADGYDMSPELARAAVAYEEQQRSLAAQRPVAARFFVDENDFGPRQATRPEARRCRGPGASRATRGRQGNTRRRMASRRSGRAVSS